MSARVKPVPWARRVRWLVLPEESLPVPEVSGGDAEEQTAETHRTGRRVQPRRVAGPPAPPDDAGETSVA